MNLRDFIHYINRANLRNIRFDYLSRFTLSDIIENKYKYDVTYELWGKKYLIYEGKYRFNLIEWYPYNGTKIHGHPKDGCIFCPLANGLVEERHVGNTIQKRQLKHGHIYYIDDNMGLHKMMNRTDGNIFSLHIYGRGDFSTIE